MNRIYWMLGITLVMGVMLGSIGSRSLRAQENLRAGKVLQRSELKAAPGWEAILVDRTLPPGAESGKETQKKGPARAGLPSHFATDARAPADRLHSTSPEVPASPEPQGKPARSALCPI
jgi:hypothetical protein